MPAWEQRSCRSCNSLTIPSDPSLKRPLAAYEDDLHPDDLLAAKVSRTSEANSGDVEAANELVASDPQSEEESNDVDVDSKETPMATKPKLKRKPRAWPQPSPVALETIQGGPQPGRQGLGILCNSRPTPSTQAADQTARAMALFLLLTKGMAAPASVHAFNLVLKLAEHSFEDVDQNLEAPGVGGVSLVFHHIDSQVLEPILLRLDGDIMSPEDRRLLHHGATQMRTGGGWQGRCARREAQGNGRCRNQVKERDKYQADDLRTLCEARCKRTGDARDWLSNALDDLVEMRERIGRYGLGDRHFRLSPQKLWELKGVAAVPDEYAA